MAVRVCSGPPSLSHRAYVLRRFRAAGAGSRWGELGVFAGFPGRSALFGEVLWPAGGEQPLPQLLAPHRVPLQAGLRWGCRCITHIPFQGPAGTQGHAGTATSLPPGKPRRGWAAWGVSGIHHFPKSRFSFFRLNRMRVSPPARARRSALPCSPAGVTGSERGRTLLTMHG